MFVATTEPAAARIRVDHIPQAAGAAHVGAAGAQQVGATGAQQLGAEWQQLLPQELPQPRCFFSQPNRPQ